MSAQYEVDPATASSTSTRPGYMDCYTKGKTARAVKEGLPTYDGLFYSRLSPDASAYVYELHEAASEHGIYLLETATGVQKPFALNGDTLSFYPAWSPDGQYVAMYNVATAGQDWDHLDQVRDLPR